MLVGKTTSSDFQQFFETSLSNVEALSNIYPALRTFLEAEDRERLLRRNREESMDNRQATEEELHAQERATSSTSIQQEREVTFDVIAETVVYEEKPATFKQESVAAALSEQVFVQNETTCIPFHVEQALKKLVLENLTA